MHLHAVASNMVLSRSDVSMAGVHSRLPSPDFRDKPGAVRCAAMSRQDSVRYPWVKEQDVLRPSATPERRLSCKPCLAC